MLPFAVLLTCSSSTNCGLWQYPQRKLQPRVKTTAAKRPGKSKVVNSCAPPINITNFSGVFFAEVGIYGGGFGKMLAGEMFGFLAEIVTGNRAEITHYPGPDFTPCSFFAEDLIFPYFYFYLFCSAKLIGAEAPSAGASDNFFDLCLLSSLSS